MNFGKLKTALRGLINRTDLSDQLAGDFVVRAISDLERGLRLGPMERVLETLPFNGTTNFISIPSDYLETIDVFTDEGELVQVDKSQFLREPTTGAPRVFSKLADRWVIRPTPASGQVLYVHHYAQSTAFAVDTDANVWATACFNATLYTAADLAADYFQLEDAVVSRFRAKASDYVEAIRAQALDEAMSGPITMSRPYGRGEY